MDFTASVDRVARKEILRQWRAFLPKGVLDGTIPFERVTPKDSDVTAYLWEENGRLYGVAWAGKAQKPDFYNRFSSKSQFYSVVKKLADSRRKHKEFVDKRRKERAEYKHTLQVGDILYSSWGYDQTNVDFYQVIGLVGDKSVKMRKIKSKVVRSDMGADYVVPVKNRFDGSPMTKRVGAGNRVKITSFSGASPWDGKPKYETSFGMGH